MMGFVRTCGYIQSESKRREEEEEVEKEVRGTGGEYLPTNAARSDEGWGVRHTS